VTSIGEDAFGGLWALREIIVAEENASYAAEGGVLFTKDMKTLVRYPRGKEASEYDVPDGVTSIGNTAFKDCNNLSNITMPDSVTSIGNGAFRSCSGLTDITLSEGVASIGSGAFIYCDSLAHITMPSSVTSIGGRAFSNCRSLINITVPGSVKSIEAGVFSDCGLLREITVTEGNGNYAAQSGVQVRDCRFSGEDRVRTVA
jgi:hypothetical protein